jgi:hypothetical protein
MYSQSAQSKYTGCEGQALTRAVSAGHSYRLSSQTLIPAVNTKHPERLLTLVTYTACQHQAHIQAVNTKHPFRLPKPGSHISCQHQAHIQAVNARLIQAVQHQTHIPAVNAMHS